MALITRSRPLAVAGSFAALTGALAFVACVGDEPMTPQPDAGGAADGSGAADGAEAKDATGASDAPGVEGSTGTDATMEAGGGEAGDGGGGASDGASDADAGTLTLPVTQGLALWLTAEDVAGQCGAGKHFARWPDRSGNQRNATTASGQTGPQCNVTGHALNGVSAAYFSDPAPSASGAVIDETLDVDLTFMVNASFTIFVVERRTGDHTAANNAEFLLGSVVPDAGSTPFHALQVGYVYYNSGDAAAQLVIDQTNNGTFTPNRPAAPAPWTYDTVRSDIGDATPYGKEIWINGVSLATNASRQPLLAAIAGGIGRAYSTISVSGGDPRFEGDIAEVIIYDVALSDTDRTSVEAYLKAHWAL